MTWMDHAMNAVAVIVTLAVVALALSAAGTGVVS